MARLCLFILAIPIWLAAGEIAAIKNMHAVNDHIYRGAQPDAEGFKALAKMGIKTVIDLRDKAVQADQEKLLVESLGMQYLSVPMNMHAPTDDQIAKVLGVFECKCERAGFHSLFGR